MKLKIESFRFHNVVVVRVVEQPPGIENDLASNGCFLRAGNQIKLSTSTDFARVKGVSGLELIKSGRVNCHKAFARTYVDSLGAEAARNALKELVVSYNDYLEERYPEKGGSKKPVTVEVEITG